MPKQWSLEAEYYTLFFGGKKGEERQSVLSIRAINLVQINMYAACATSNIDWVTCHINHTLATVRLVSQTAQMYGWTRRLEMWPLHLGNLWSHGFWYTFFGGLKNNYPWASTRDSLWIRNKKILISSLLSSCELKKMQEFLRKRIFYADEFSRKVRCINSSQNNSIVMSK